MKSFSEYLLLESMTTKEAEQLLGLSGKSYGEKELKKAFLDAAKINHPDIGGSLELMKQINIAFDKLKGSSAGGSGNSKQDFEQQRAENEKRNVEWRRLAKRALGDLLDAYNPGNFIKHFNKLSGKKFRHNIAIQDAQNPRETPYNISFKSSYTTPDNKEAFEFDIYVVLASVKNTRSLGGGDGTISFPLQATAFGYVNRKKKKMSQRDWKNGNDHKILNDPELSFPEKKLKKIFSSSDSPSKMKKADFALALKKELKANMNQEWVEIPLKEKDKILVLWRQVFMGTAGWAVHSISEKSGKYSTKVVTQLLLTLPEDSTTIDLLLKAVKERTADGVIKALGAKLSNRR